MEKTGCLKETLKFIGNVALGYIPLAPTYQHSVKGESSEAGLMMVFDLSTTILPLGQALNGLLSHSQGDLLKGLGVFAVVRLLPAMLNGLLSLRPKN